METTTEVLAENVSEVVLAIAYNNQLLESILSYIQWGLILIVGILLYKFITAFTGT
ncbi:MAG: hypothetical protein IJT84_00925 [Clostridia bacterium]|nr:hypothetical protein [Clostridia bacterium]